ncbi:amidase family protein [Myxacorys almedinensis]|uniref:amidase family protein n=1 Tax=Myxacorys almedinensis TaxID=2651157 RepID=UPI0030831E0C
MRQPAHFCGIYSLKPTDRRISTAGIIPEVPGMPYCFRQMMTVGYFARSLHCSTRYGFRTLGCLAHSRCSDSCIYSSSCLECG